MLFAFLCINYANAQNILDRKITIKLKNASVPEALNAISKQINFYFTYDDDLPVANKNINKNFIDAPLHKCLNEIFNDTSLVFQVFENHIIIKKREAVQIDSLLNNPGIKYLILQAKLIDADNAEPLPFASVTVENEHIGTVTNSMGVFILKIPKEMIQKQICISYLGYDNTCFPAIELYKNFQTIQLKRNYISLHEIIIRNRDPRKIIRSFIENIPENYAQKPVYLTTFYREKIKKKNKYMFLSEAVLKIYKTAYTNTQNDLIKILKSRSFKNVKKTDSVQLKLKSGLHTAMVLDLVKNRLDFLNQDFFSDYRYQINDIENYDNAATYIINFEPRKYAKDAIYRGELYINVDNYAVIGVNYEIAPDKIKSMNNRFIIKKQKGLNVKLKKAAYQVNYHFWNGKYYLKYVGADLNFKVKMKKKWFATNFTTILEMAVSDIDTIDVQKFKRKESYKTNTIFADEIHDYDEQFWDDYNFIKPEDDWQEAIRKLQLKLKLQ